LAEYANGAKTAYAYDAETFRLLEVKTFRASDNSVLQDLLYTYDPVGNVISIRDNAPQPVYFNNQVVTANGNYVYDPLYRLISATGREHIGQLAQPQTTWDDTPRMNQPLPTDSQAMRNYKENYAYDSVGNFLQVVHQAIGGNWTRNYGYDEPNVPAANNRLTSTTVGPLADSYQYDTHGNTTRMPHLPAMDWDFKDQLHKVDLQGGGTAYYVYDASGQRLRKVIERQGGIVEERLYLGGFEIYRKRSSGTITLERQTLHVMDNKRRVALAETKTIDATVPTGALPSSVTRYQFDNHLGSAVLELDDNAAIISYEEYYPYGSTSYQAGRSAAEVSLKRYRYTGKERDDETGLYYHGARYYAPWIGRWTSCDPGGLVDGTNPYQYGRANPIRFIDSSGKVAGDPDSSSKDHQIAQTKKTENVKAPRFVPRPDPPESWKALWAREDYAVATGARQGPIGYDRPPNLGWGPMFTTKELAWDQVIFARDLSVNLPFMLDALPEAEALGAGTMKLARALLSEDPGAALNLLKEMLSIGTESEIAKEGRFISMERNDVLTAKSGPNTGVARFDKTVEEMKGTLKFERWVRNMEQRGFRIEIRPLSGEGNFGTTIPGIIELDPEARYIDLLHETRHSAQLEEYEFTSMKDVRKRNLQSPFEVDAYDYELRVGRQAGFSEEYMNVLETRRADYWGLMSKTKRRVYVKGYPWK
jgi:RHS repeat-associated protein